MNEWIDINDRQPERDGRYLVVEAYPYHHWIGVSCMRDGKFDMNVTHWMELPKLP